MNIHFASQTVFRVSEHRVFKRPFHYLCKAVLPESSHRYGKLRYFNDSRVAGRSADCLLTVGWKVVSKAVDAPHKDNPDRVGYVLRRRRKSGPGRSGFFHIFIGSSIDLGVRVNMNNHARDIADATAQMRPYLRGNPVPLANGELGIDHHVHLHKNL